MAPRQSTILLLFFLSFYESVGVMNAVTRMKLFNFKRFQKFDVVFDEKINVFIGNNEAGKSSLLLALDLALSGSKNKVENLGLESLFNATVIADFLAGDKKLEQLPNMWIELYLNEQDSPDLNGRNNSEGELCDGLRLVCEPIDDFSDHIRSVLLQKNANFPFEYYSVGFFTFSGEQYSGYRKFMICTGIKMNIADTRTNLRQRHLMISMQRLTATVFQFVLAVDLIWKPTSLLPKMKSQ